MLTSTLLSVGGLLDRYACVPQALIVGATLGQTLYRIASTSKFCAAHCWTAAAADDADEARGGDDAVDDDDSNDQSGKQYTESGVAASDSAFAGFGDDPDDGGGTASSVASKDGAGAGAGSAGEEEEDKLPTVLVIVLFVLTRMVVCPVVCCALVWGVSDKVITSSDPADAQLIKLVLVLEAIVPSADFVIVTAQRAGQSDRVVPSCVPL